MSAADRGRGHAGGTGRRDMPLNGGKCQEVNRQLRALQRQLPRYRPWSGLQAAPQTPGRPHPTYSCRLAWHDVPLSHIARSYTEAVAPAGRAVILRSTAAQY